jgi:predicted Ser/Thr protein kinase
VTFWRRYTAEMVARKIGQYRVIERLGAGGMGHVYRAIDESLGRDVALKILDAGTDNAAARLRSEAAALARIDHSGIATVHELIEDDGRLVMVMEFVRGRTLQHMLEQVGVFTPQCAAELCLQTLGVLEHAHEAGVVHRDLKPGNLMIADSGAVKILDFGIARLNDSVGLTMAGTMLGTPAYMAPEQVLGHPIDARTDLYAMGVVFFRLITAALPFKGETPFDMAQSQVSDAPMKATDVRPDLPAWVDEILSRALAKEPADRFQSAAEFRKALADASEQGATKPAAAAAALEVTEVLQRPDLAKPPVAARPQKRPRAASSRSAWLGAAVVIAAGAWVLMPKHRTPPASATEATVAPVEAPVSQPEPIAVDQPVVTKVAANTTTAVPARSMPAPSPSPVNSAPAALAAAAARPPASFNDLKSLAVSGSRASTSDVVVQFSDTGVTVQPADGKTAPEVFSYHSIAKATYAQSKDPKLDPALSHPTEKIDVPGIGVLSRSRHWLVLQGSDRYLILRLDGNDRLDVMKAFEERAGIVIDKK